MLGDLDGVERGALAQVVRDNPQVEAVRHGVVGPDAADKGVVEAVAVCSKRVEILRGIVHYLDPGRLRENLARLFGGDLRCKLDVDRFGVPSVDGDANGRRGDLDRVSSQSP